MVTFSLLKITLYSLLLWLPIYIDSKGYSQYSGSLPALFNAISIFGSFSIGKIYEGQAGANRSKCLSYSMVVLGLLISCALLLVVAMTEFNMIYFAIIVFCLGFVLGGLHNVYETNEALRINEEK